MILSIDIGTSALKVGLFSEDGGLEASAWSAPRFVQAGHLSMNPESWIDCLRSTLAELFAGAGAASREPDCVVISGQGPTVLPVDAQGRSLHAALGWMDRRATVQAAAASRAAGLVIDPAFLLPKAMWFQAERPGLYEKTSLFLCCPEYLIRRLCGESLMVVPEGYEKHYGGEGLAAALGLDPSKLPRPVAPGSVAGRIDAAGERDTGLPRGALVVAAGPDYLAAIIGTGSIVPGRACDRAGSSEGINLCAPSGIAEPRLLSMPHIIRPYTNISGSISNSGAALDWWLGLCRKNTEPSEARRELELLMREAGQAPRGAGRLLFLPYLCGERAPIGDPLARGAFIGLGLGHGKAHMSRAVLESTAFAMRDVIDVMESAGAEVSELRIAGRPAKSRIWNQIKADITGKPVLAGLWPEAELVGDACFGMKALGYRASLAEAAELLVRLGGRYDPEPGARGLYAELFGLYRQSYASLKTLFAALATGSEEGPCGP